MQNNLSIFDKSTVSNAIKEKLHELAHQQQIGAYILALANALSDKSLYQYLEEDLKNILVELSKNRPNSSPDDNTVFDKLIDSSLEFPQLAQRKQVGPWTVQYNPMRAYRPARNANDIITSIYKPFDDNGFHFNKPFLQKEKLKTISFKQTQIDLFLNKFPFSENHLLLLINPKSCSAQLLTLNTLKLISKIAANIPNQNNTYFAYNSIGSYASVNHLHFHFNSLQAPLPISNKQWSHNGGDSSYPLHCYKVTSANDAWAIIEKLHQQNKAYNVIIENTSIYVIPRTFQATIKHAQWIQNIAWFELAGVMTVANKDIYDNLTENMVSTELSKLSIHL